jgi:NTE family protein
MKTKYALVLSGGGFKGAFQVGALKYLKENWQKITGLASPMKFDIISGVSAGSINGSMLAMGKFDLLEELWQLIGENGASEIYTSEFIDTDSKEDKLKFKFDILSLIKRFNLKIDINLNFFQKLEMIFSKSKRKEVVQELIQKIGESLKENYKNFRSIASNKPLLEKLKLYLDRNKIEGTVFTAGFVSLNTGTYNCVKHSEFATNEDFVNGVLASTAIPLVWEPVDKVKFIKNGMLQNSHNNVDGGLMNVSPLGDVIRLIEEDSEDCKYKVIVINCNSGIPKYENFSNKGIGAIAARSAYELTLNEIFNNDIDHFVRINDLVKHFEVAQVELKNPNGRVIKSFEAMIINPDSSVDLGSPLAANEKLIQQRIQHGFDQASKSKLFNN